MKKANLFSLGLLAISLLSVVYSCKKSSNPQPSATGSLSVTVNGTSFTTNRVVGVDTLGYVDIVGLLNNGKDSGVVEVKFNDKYGLGTYRNDTADMFLYYNGTNTQAGYNGPAYFVIYDANYYNSDLPTITVSSWNKTTGAISGSFQGTTWLVNFSGLNNPLDSAIQKNGTFSLTLLR